MEIRHMFPMTILEQLMNGFEAIRKNEEGASLAFLDVLLGEDEQFLRKWLICPKTTLLITNTDSDGLKSIVLMPTGKGKIEQGVSAT